MFFIFFSIRIWERKHEKGRQANHLRCILTTQTDQYLDSESLNKFTNAIHKQFQKVVATRKALY